MIRGRDKKKEKRCLTASPLETEKMKKKKEE